MHMTAIRRAFAGFGAGLLTLLFATTPSAQAATPQTTTTMASVCATGFRGQPAYDRHCLITGNYYDAQHVWEHAGYTRTERHAQCHTALHSGMITVVKETRGDIISDTYRNDGAMVRLTAWAGAQECFRIH